MKSTNKSRIQQEFTKQAAGFESEHMSFSKQDYLNYVVQRIAPSKTDSVLEAAAGTCICGRTIAPHAGNVVCLDMTPAMLSVGKSEAEKCHLDNMTFVLGDAAELPFLNDSFNIVLSRLAFHHFPDVKQPFAEMARVLRSGGRLILIDMEAAEEPLREIEDSIETMRDPSHIRNLSKNEMLSLYHDNDLSVSCCEVTKIPLVLQNWLDHTKTPSDVQTQIKNLMLEEINGGAKTGFAPYISDGKICFDQRWTLTIGTLQ